MTDTAAGRRRLGRGLEALLGPSREEAEREGSLVELPVSEIHPNPYQPRGDERLIQEFSLTQQDVAAAVGRDRSTVANALRLLRLPDAVLTMIHEGHLSVGHARALLALEDLRQVTILARDAVAQGWSVREVEDRVRGGRAPERRPRLKRGMAPAPEVRRVEDALRRRLGTDVRVSLRAKGKGQLHISFYSNDDLARLLELMLGAPFDG